jgi:protein arginine N-methyltransferase 3
LDFLDNIKLVNYVRSEVKNGNNSPDVSSKSKFEDDAYLKPVLEDDALLYSLDDLAEEQGETSAPGTEAERQVLELQENLERLQTQFSEYRLAVQQSMDDQLSKEDEKLAESTPKPSSHAIDRHQEAEDGYFVSYAYNGMKTPPIEYNSVANFLLKQSTNLC